MFYRQNNWISIGLVSIEINLVGLIRVANPFLNCASVSSSQSDSVIFTVLH